MAKIYKNKKGEEKKWFSPNEKRQKYSKDLKAKKDTYSHEELTATQLAWRAGYNKRATEEADLYYLKHQDKYVEKYGTQAFEERFGKKPVIGKHKPKKTKENTLTAREQELVKQINSLKVTVDDLDLKNV